MLNENWQIRWCFSINLIKCISLILFYYYYYGSSMHKDCIQLAIILTEKNEFASDLAN